MLAFKHVQKIAHLELFRRKKKTCIVQAHVASVDMCFKSSLPRHARREEKPTKASIHNIISVHFSVQHL